MARKTVDCREYPSQTKCSLTISGEEEEVVRAAVLHAVDVHGEKDTSELRSTIRRALKEESAPA
jgi:predicted small metal-binding protein